MIRAWGGLTLAGHATSAGTAATKKPGWARGLRRVRFWGRRRAGSLTCLNPPRAPRPCRSQRVIEKEGFDLVHVPTQVLSSLRASIYPRDLQHCTCQYFTPEAFRKRESEYRAFCAQAVMVAAATRWQKLT